MPVQFCSQRQLQITNSRSTPESEHNPIRTPVLVLPLWLVSLHARNLLLSNIYTQLQWQMYRNFTHFPPTHLQPVCIFLCTFVFWDRGLFCDEERRRAKLHHKWSEISLPFFHPGVSGGDRCGWLQMLGSFYYIFFGVEGGRLCFTVLGEGEIQIYCWSCDNWRTRQCREKTQEAQPLIIHNCKTKRFIRFRFKHSKRKRKPSL